MMPFSVLRIFGLGLFSWAFLGLGIYCGYRAYEEYRRTAPPRIVRTDVQRDAETDETPERDRPTQTVVVRDSRPDWSRMSRSGWLFLASAVALLGFSFGGSIPMRWLLSAPTGNPPRRVTPAKELTVARSDGSRLHVQIYGPQTAPTLVLTHGWSLNISAWDYALEQLSQRYRVVAWDLPGLGRSKAPDNGDLSLEVMAHDLNAVIGETATDRPLVLLGHSIGGMITQTFCRLHPERLGSTVAGLILVHTTYTNPLRTCFAASLATALENVLITPLNYLMIPLAPLAWLSNWQSYLNGSLHTSTRFTSFSGKQTAQQLEHAALLAVQAWPGVLARGNLAMQRFNEEATLPKIDLPVLVFAGRHDRMTLPSASAHLDNLLPESRLFEADTGHLGHWEQAEKFVQAVTEFVDHVVGDAVGSLAAHREQVEQ